MVLEIQPLFANPILQAFVASFVGVLGGTITLIVVGRRYIPLQNAALESLVNVKGKEIKAYQVLLEHQKENFEIELAAMRNPDRELVVKISILAMIAWAAWVLWQNSKLHPPILAFLLLALICSSATAADPRQFNGPLDRHHSDAGPGCTNLEVSGRHLVSLTLAWDANPEPNIATYRVYYGTIPRFYTMDLTTGNTTTVDVPGLTAGQIYYFAMDAVNTLGIHSLLSAEISTPLVTISGKITYCGTNLPAAGVTVTLTGDVTMTTSTDAEGDYALTLPILGSYTVTPSLAPLVAGGPGSSVINTVDAMAVQKYFLDPVAAPLVCPLAADVNQDGIVNTPDAMGIQQFALGIPLAQVGQRRFEPALRQFPGLAMNQTFQKFEIRTLGDVK